MVVPGERPARHLELGAARVLSRSFEEMLAHERIPSFLEYARYRGAAGPVRWPVSSTGQRPTYKEDRTATENVTPPGVLFVGELFRVDDLSAEG